MTAFLGERSESAIALGLPAYRRFREKTGSRRLHGRDARLSLPKLRRLPAVRMTHKSQQAQELTHNAELQEPRMLAPRRRNREQSGSHVSYGASSSSLPQNHDDHLVEWDQIQRPASGRKLANSTLLPTYATDKRSSYRFAFETRGCHHKEEPVRVVLRVWSTNPDCSTGCDYAVVEIGQELVKRMLRRLNVLREQKTIDPSIFEIYYWDYSPQYFSPWVNRPAQPQEFEVACCELEKTLDELQVDTCEVVSVPVDFCVPDSQIAAVECAQMIVREESIAFTAIPKHADICLTTAEISKQVLESILRTAAV
jgi:hypothetical protein